MIGFLAVVGLVALLAGAVAAVAGFGIGSLLTPLLAWQYDTKLAVVAVSIPHAAATALRFWLLRKHIHRQVLLSFGIMSAVGGLAGAFLHNFADSPILTMVFGGLLVFAGLMGLTGLSERMRFKGWVAWVAGSLSGLLGGLVGNQGGIRSGAMLGFDVPKEAFVATATAIGLIVDGVRMPVYLITEGSRLVELWPVILAATVGTSAGTIVGGRLLKRVPETLFRRLVSVLLLGLGVVMFFRIGQ